MNAVVIFDVSLNTNSVKERMRAKGYYFSWMAEVQGQTEKKEFHLPSNIVWKPNIEAQEALDDLKQVIQALNSNSTPTNTIKLLRCIILNSTPWFGMVGEKP